MAVFAVLMPVNNATLEQSIEERFKTDALKIRPGQWLVAAPGTAKELSDTLGVTDGSNGSAVIITAASYFGRANPSIWEWIRAKWDGHSDG